MISNRIHQRGWHIEFTAIGEVYGEIGHNRSGSIPFALFGHPKYAIRKNVEIEVFILADNCCNRNVCFLVQKLIIG